ncbi:MAG: CoA transferase [Hyphomicrobiaceae bacterium]|nr:CoA transferase [Hyphomicrobiaceae bacterium]
MTHHDRTPAATAPLAGLRVLDLTIAMAGPLCTQRLGDMGAEIIKVESPNRPDITRSAVMADVLLDGEATPYLTLNRNKRSIGIDLKVQGARAVLDRLVPSVDIVIQNMRPLVARRLGLDYASFKRLKDNIIYVSISGYGEDGPMVERPGQDLLVQSFSGLTWLAGTEDGPPHPAPVYMIDVMTSHLATEGVLAAVVQRDRTGIGCEVKVSLLGAALEVQIQELSTWLTTGRFVKRGKAPYASTFQEPPYGIYKTGDGHIAIAQSSLGVIAEVLGSNALADLAASRPVREEHAAIDEWRDRVYPVIADLLAGWETEAAVEALHARGVWCGPVNDYPSLLAHPQLQGCFATMEHPTAGPVTTVAPQIRFSTQPEPQLAPAPALGADTDDVLSAIGYAPQEIAALRAAGAVA